MSNIEKLLNSLDRVKQTGADKWLARCPAHDDNNPSLAISLKDDRILLKCWSGCGGVAIMEATGLPMDVFAPAGVLDRSTDKISSVFGPPPRKKASEEEYILAVAKADREAGRRLTEKEKQIEREAFLRLKKRGGN